MIFIHICPGCGNRHNNGYEKLNFCYICRKDMGGYSPRERVLLRKTALEKEQEERDSWQFDEKK